MKLISSLLKYLGILKPSIEETFTWKYIDLDPKLTQVIKDIYLANLNQDLTNYGFFQRLPINIPDIMGCKITSAALIYCCGNHKSSHSHKDPYAEASTFALNIPLINCENSKTTLYRNLKKPQYHIFKARITEIGKIIDCEVITSYVLDKPILFNTQILHAIENYSNKPRLAISLRFDKNPLEWI